MLYFLYMRNVNPHMTKIFLDSGNPEETKEALSLLGFLDGQTTNPSLVAKNPHIVQLKEQKLLNPEVIWDKYREVALEILEVIPGGAISVEVYADQATTHDTMLFQGRLLATWFPDVYVKLPATEAGLKTAEVLVAEGIRVNITLVFSQEQAAAVHMATKNAKPGQVFISPFIGRLDDINQEGFDVVKNIKHMYKAWGSHVMVLAASIRSLEHVKKCLESEIDIITAPLSIFKEWVANPNLEITDPVTSKQPVPLQEIQQKPWMEYNIRHELTDKGIEKFASDWQKLFE